MRRARLWAVARELGVVVVHYQRHNMADAVGKKPAGVGNHGCQQIVPAAIPETAETQNADR